MSQYHLDVALKQVKRKLPPHEQELLENERSTVVCRIKRVMSLGKNYRLKVAKNGKSPKEAPMSYIIDLTDGAIADMQKAFDADKSGRAAVARAAVARRKLPFSAESQESSVDATDNSPASTPTSSTAVPTTAPKSKAEVTKSFRERMDSVRSTRRNRKRKTQTRKTQKGTKNQTMQKSAQPAQKLRRSKRTKKSVNYSDEDESGETLPTRAGPAETLPARADPGETLPTRADQRTVTPTFKPGSKVCGRWKGPSCEGEWYDGVVKSIDMQNQTVHVVYVDGDEDTDLKWCNMRVLEP